jgi:hypothetical protein
MAVVVVDTLLVIWAALVVLAWRAAAIAADMLASITATATDMAARPGKSLKVYADRDTKSPLSATRTEPPSVLTFRAPQGRLRACPTCRSATRTDSRDGHASLAPAPRRARKPHRRQLQSPPAPMPRTISACSRHAQSLLRPNSSINAPRRSSARFRRGRGQNRREAPRKDVCSVHASAFRRPNSASRCA